MTTVNDGVLIDWSHRGVPEGIETYAHEAGLIVFWDPMKRVGVPADTNGMTRTEIQRTIAVALALLDDAPIPGECIN